MIHITKAEVRIPCSSCPYKRGLQKDERFITTAREKDPGKIHVCHRKVGDVFNDEEIVTVGNVCMGALEEISLNKR